MKNLEGTAAKDSPLKSTLLIILYLLFVYGTLPIAPSIVKALQKIGPLSFVVNTSICIFLALVFLAVLIRSRFYHWHFLLSIVPLGILTIWGLSYISLPIERIHVVEYAILSILLFRTFSKHARIYVAIVQSLFIASLAGSIDEAIQYFLPNRFFSVVDIYLNIGGASAGLLYYGLYRWFTRDEN